MLFKNITILDECFETKKGMFVGISEDKITYIGDSAPKQDCGKTYDGKNKLLMTGFINAHSHTPMTLLRGYGENLSLGDWLNTRIFPFEAKLNAQDIYYGTLLGAAEMLRFGIVSTTDMYFSGESIIKAMLQSGVKSNVSVAVTCFDDHSYQQHPKYEEAEYLMKHYHNAQNGKIKIDLSIHAEYTSTPKVVEGLALHAKERGLNTHIHLSETKSEHEQCKEKRKMTPAQYFNKLGMFGNHTTAAHCVWLEGEDFDILKEKKVSVASCPVSNLKLASGVCDIKKLYEYGINVAIGTDSVASNNNLNMIEEMKFFALTCKGKSFDPTLVTPKQAIKGATVNGAIAQGRDDCGLLKVGNRADLIVIDLDKPYYKPCYDIANNLVYAGCGTDVCLTMVDGKVLYRDGEYKTIDMEKTLYEVNHSVQRILSDLR